ncbi:MAG: glycosyl hydrolase [Mucilaginibacter sp.]|nr:glycosyl hydrolase [Mucilaginibacter sp.]
MQLKKYLFTAFVAFIYLSSFISKAQGKYFNNWPSNASPQEIGRLVAEHFIATTHPNFGSPKPPKSITYPEACAWYGALLYASSANDTMLIRKLANRFEPFYGGEKNLVPVPDMVDNTVFGSVPLELYLLTKDKKYLETGLSFADRQWLLPDHFTPAMKELADKGLSWQTRLWIDDMFMITTIQMQAYRATGNHQYIDRAAKEMVYYLDQLQQPNGLFYHAEDVPFFWARGNGWMAAGMTELLSVLPTNNEYKARILVGYKKMMASLKNYQAENGMWRQLIDDKDAWFESSGTGMFTYAIITGVKKGWLNKNEYGPTARKGWLALVSHINKNGDIDAVCEGTNKKNDRQYYLDRKTLTGDMHGQAPVLWCASALLDK